MTDELIEVPLQIPLMKIGVDIRRRWPEQTKETLDIGEASNQLSRQEMKQLTTQICSQMR
jgi:hypothetical protein